MSMQIWKADPDDIPALMPHARYFHDNGIFRDKPFNEEGARQYLLGMMQDANSRIYMHSKGCFGMRVERARMNSGFVLQEHFFRAIDRTGEPLMQAFEAFGDQMRIRVRSMSMQAAKNALPPKLVEYYAQKGYFLAEGVFIKHADFPWV